MRKRACCRTAHRRNPCCCINSIHLFVLPPTAASQTRDKDWLSPVFMVWWRTLMRAGCTLLSESASGVVTSTGRHPKISNVIFPFSNLVLFPFAKTSITQHTMGFFSSRSKKKDVHVHIYQQTVCNLSPSALQYSC